MSYYGSKWVLAKRYPAPLHATVVEPFAGAAGYSTRHYEHQVVLVDASPQVIGAWAFLLGSTPEQILRLPLLQPHQLVAELDACQEARWLIGWWAGKGAERPRASLSAWGREPRYARQFWGPEIRSRIAIQAEKIRHWRVFCGDYREVSAGHPVTWFVDPPYQGPPGRRYPHHQVDYVDLASWCKERQGQVIVCEQVGADWLPFTPLAPAYSNLGRRDPERRALDEAVWVH
jgi:site-specific DNA-adenine methylase